VLFWLAAAPGLAHAADRYAGMCQPEARSRIYNPQGTMLWGTRQDWDPAAAPDERQSVMVSVGLEKPVRGPARALELREGRLLPVAPGAGASLDGTVLRGSSSSGQPVEVAICGAEPVAGDGGGYVRYRIQAWNPVAGTWENPCARTSAVGDPRALAVDGVWDGSGVRRDVRGKFTFACENGAIAKCVGWGYSPWSSREGQPLAELHQACTRMARADYCGDGRSHTVQGTMIDIYDTLGVQKADARSTALANAFEATWSVDGATCLAATRSGQPLDAVLRECPARFEWKEMDLGGGDRCLARRTGEEHPDARLRTRIIPHAPPASGQHMPPPRPRAGL
jgi:hypothetical protein